ncbi:hypothetical protein O181_007170 [Austropuccinia psidii MF-1]|uniref:Xaa-Pro aminopeptidase P n=1 Tax=Austropuccinia psidii MF-1 TaxID=1389203 RepID=A0A9Q3GHL1_9BASI|nr:hypothetical protein [Austropuccinia psidii MF-1]
MIRAVWLTSSIERIFSSFQPHLNSFRRMTQADRNHGPIDTSNRLEGVKKLMKSYDVSIYIVPTQDAHGSEYICPADARREYLTGFTGSAGTALVLLNQTKSLLFTDGRYFNQASKQLHPDYWQLMKYGIEGVPTWQEYLVKAASNTPSDSGLRIGLDPTLISAKEAESLREKLFRHSSQLVSISENLVDVQWGSSRPPRSHQPIRKLDLQYTGQARQDKLIAVQASLKAFSNQEETVIGMLVNALDEIAWCLNLRGNDIAYNPVFFSYLWINADAKAILFVDQVQLTPELKQELIQDGIEIKSYNEIWDFLQNLRSSQKSSPTSQKVFVSFSSSLAIQNSLGGPSATLKVRSPIEELKAIKNQIEIQGFKNSHIRDGAALVSYFAWLEELLLNPQSKPLNEFDAATKLEEFRKHMGCHFFQGLSFSTISSTGKNAAIIHYSPDRYESAVIDKEEIYLCDSGAQYLDGTTDVTRTLHFGTPTNEQIRAFTRVLQGHISLAQVVFPEKTTGALIDSLARQYLWQDGLDYRHGTGHGVGHYLNVHEGPQGIGTRPEYNQVGLRAGMTLSNEPGYYKDESFGIRIESVVVTQEKHTRESFGDRKYLGFENLTVCPIQTKLIDKSLMNEDQVKWVNEYHKDVLAKLTPLLQDDSRALKWLIKECQPI